MTPSQKLRDRRVRKARALKESRMSTKPRIRIKMTELKKLIREEVRRARSLKEQGRPISIPLGRPAELGSLDIPRGRPATDVGGPYGQRELLQYVRTFASTKRGRPSEWDVDDGTQLVTLSTDELLSAYNEREGTMMDVYSTAGDHLGQLPLVL